MNWIAEQSQTGQDLNSIHSFDGVNAWAVGNIGVIVTNYSPTTNVENENNNATNSLALEQNYPNPFNPSTTIKFSIPECSNTIIKVYNTVGSEVATLLNEVKQPGTYEVDFNAV